VVLLQLVRIQMALVAVVQVLQVMVQPHQELLVVLAVLVAVQVAVEQATAQAAQEYFTFSTRRSL
jgi:hypothetical protein